MIRRSSVIAKPRISGSTTAPPRSNGRFPMLTKKSAGDATAQGRLARAVAGMHGRTIDRRTFLKRSGVTAGAAAFAAQLPYGAIGKAEAQTAAAPEATGAQVRRTGVT